MIDEVLAKYPNDVNVVIKNFPLGSHKQAKKAAQYALAAHKQGKYKEMYHKIFDEYKSLRNNEDLPKTIAAELGLDIAQLMEDMQSKEIIDLIDWEYNQLASLRNAYPETEEYASGVRIAVPKFFINGREPIGRGIEQFSTMIDEELEKLNIIKPSVESQFIPYDQPPIQKEPTIGDLVIYPKSARKAGIEGKVYIQAFINAEGIVTEAKIIKGIPNTGLDEAALNAVKKSRWYPARQRYKKVGVWITIPVNFSLI